METNQKKEVYVLQVSTGQEQDVVNKLKIAGYEAIAPMQWESIRKGGHWRDGLRTVMPGYVFVVTELDVGAYYAITAQQGVMGILKRGDTPIPLSDDELVRLQWLLGQDVLEPTVVQRVTTDDGERIYKLIAGPLAGLHHEISNASPRQRKVTVRITMAGSTKEVALSAKFV